MKNARLKIEREKLELMEKIEHEKREAEAKLEREKLELMEKIEHEKREAERSS